METKQPESYLTKVGRRFKYGILYMLVGAPIGFALGCAVGAVFAYFAQGDAKAVMACAGIGALIFARAGMAAGIRRADLS